MAKPPHLTAVALALAFVLSAAGYGIVRGFTEEEPASAVKTVARSSPGADERVWAAKLCEIGTDLKDAEPIVHGGDAKAIQAYADANEKAEVDLEKLSPPEYGKPYHQLLQETYREVARFARDQLAAGADSAESFDRALADHMAPFVASLRQTYDAIAPYTPSGRGLCDKPGPSPGSSQS